MAQIIADKDLSHCSLKLRFDGYPTVPSYFDGEYYPSAPWIPGKFDAKMIGGNLPLLGAVVDEAHFGKLKRIVLAAFSSLCR